jgi:beta-N-acetylhexosaminidase
VSCARQAEPVSVTEEETVIDQPDWIAEALEAMTLRQKIAALIVVGLEDTAVNDQIRQKWSQYPFGGVIIYERNYIKDEWLKEFTADLCDLALPNYPLLVCIDEEGGSISRLPGERFPSAADMAKMSEEEVFLIGGQMAGKLKGYGINVNFAPVLDVNIDPRNTVIGSRSFGSDPEVVSSYGIALFRGMADQGVIPVGKHYPGHGSTLVDSHLQLPVLEKNKAELLAFELIPFKRAVEAGIPMIMTAHLVVSGIDSKPATMSSEIIAMLRNDLGFSGVIISDDLEMGALTENYSWEEIIVETFMAGVDLLLIGHSDELQAEAVRILEEAYAEGTISEERLNSSLRRVMEMQQALLR